MKINTISAYVLVCLLTFSQWNLIVLVRAAGYGTSATPELKLFKDDCSGNPVEMETSDFSQINYIGYLIYHFTVNVECVLVKFGDAEVWKKGVDSVEEPISVSYNSDEHKVVLFDDKKSVFYKKDNSGNWVHHLTIQRNEPASTDTSESGEGGGTTVELGSLYPDSGGSTVEVKAKSAAPGSENAGKAAGENEGTTVELGSLYPDSCWSTVDATPESTPAEFGLASGEGGDTDESSCDSDPTHTGGADGQSDGEESLRGAASTPPANQGSGTDNGGEEAEENEESGQGEEDEKGAASCTLPANGGTATDVSSGGGTETSGYTGTHGSGTDISGETVDGSGTPESGTGTGGGSAETSGGGSTHTNGGSDGDTTPSKPNDPNKTPASDANEVDPNEYPKDVKLYKADPNDASKLVEIDESDYKVKKDFDEFTYKFNTGVNCTLVKREDKDVWKFDSSKNSGKYPKEVGVMDDIVIVRINGASLMYEKKNEMWNHYETIQV
ncbi:hypothetical protein MACJ_002389 [Theileria orientalis]|uniref:Uncharacterized protein n=1 Tax=Theileria orientalis TaxID=68886 RepID=A0A976M664_THEOR|nr:hypothetical protein MACJ_002389 [Theileria orientalis]